MTQDERRRFLLAALLRERTPSRAPALPPDADGQRLLLRALLNLRPPAPVGQTFCGCRTRICRRSCGAGVSPTPPACARSARAVPLAGDLTTLRVRRNRERRQQPSARLLLSQPRVRR